MGSEIETHQFECFGKMLLLVSEIETIPSRDEGLTCSRVNMNRPFAGTQRMTDAVLTRMRVQMCRWTTCLRTLTLADGNFTVNDLRPSLMTGGAAIDQSSHKGSRGNNLLELFQRGDVFPYAQVNNVDHSPVLNVLVATPDA